MRVTPMLAESYWEFKRYILQNEMNIGHFAYISDMQKLIGHRGVVLATGRWWRNPNYNDEFQSELHRCVNHGSISIVKAVVNYYE